MQIRRRFVVPTLLALASVTAFAPAPAAPCTAVVPQVDVSSWQLVESRGFTLCVPSDWRGGGNTRRKGGSSVSWGTGTAPRSRLAVSGMAVVTRMPPPAPAPGSEARRFNEDVGGRSVTLYRNHSDGKYSIGAQWDSPGVWIEGESPDLDVADLILNVARTVRFVDK